MSDNPSTDQTPATNANASVDTLDRGSSSTPVQDDLHQERVVQLPMRSVPQRAVKGAGVVDITAKFTQACSGLEIGQLVKDEYFTLFESIGALEIMDPKMDSGFLKPGETLEDDYDALKPLLPEEVIGIMDQLLCHEMAWHTGYPLSQTLFTSVYIDKLLWPEPKSLEEAQFYRGEPQRQPNVLHQVLRAYCMGLIKCSAFTIQRITSRDYFEEEDFCTHAFNRQLFWDVPHDLFMQDIDAALEALEKESFAKDLSKALTTRLKFRHRLLKAMAPDHPVEYLRNYWSRVSDTLPDISSSHTLGKPVLGSFSNKIQRRLASTVPPRPIVDLQFPEAFEKLKELCTACQDATRYTRLESDPQEYQNFLHTFAARSPPPLPYARSHLSTLVFTSPHAFSSYLLTELSHLVFPSSSILSPTNWALSPPRNPALPKDPRLQTAEIIDEFLQRAAPVYSDFWSALCQNRCRMRRMLCHTVLALDQLQADAGVLDEEVMGLGVDESGLKWPLTTWVYAGKLRVIERVVGLGFEQEIYLGEEWAGMYLFLSRISDTRARLLMTVARFWEKRMGESVRGKRGEDVELKADAEHIDSLLAEASGISDLSAALRHFYTLLAHLSLLPNPNRPFSTPELRYELRMKPFLTLAPREVPPFEEFEEELHPFGDYPASSSTSLSPSLVSTLRDPDLSLWEEIENSVKSAKENFAKVKKLGPKAAKAEGVKEAWGKEIQGLLMSCVALGVAVAGVKEAVKGWDGEDELGVKVEVPEAGTGKRYVEGWVIPKIVRG